MEHSRKMMVVPYTGSQNTSHVSIPKKSKSIKEKSVEKIKKILTIILKLAKINGYDESGRINDNGNFIENSDIVALIQYALTPGKVLIGENEFAELLIKAGVSPDVITNDNLKAKIIKSRTKEKIVKEPHDNEKSQKDDSIKSSAIDVPMSNVDKVENKRTKRSFDEIESEEEIYKPTDKKAKRSFEEENNRPKKKFVKKNSWYLPSDDEDL